MSEKGNLDELLAVLENIRRERYPHIPAEIINQIVVAQYENQDKRPDARNLTYRIVNEFLANIAKSEEK